MAARVQKVQKVQRVQRVEVSPLRAMLIKSALRDWLYGSYSLIRILVISRYAAPPYPAAPDFLHGKACHTILRSLCSLTNRVPLPPHPGDRINRSMLSCRDMAPWLSTHSPTAPRWQGNTIRKGAKRPENRVTRFPAGREGGAVRHQRGNASPSPARAVVWFYYKRAPSINL